jgi:hypothetical protein
MKSGKIRSFKESEKGASSRESEEINFYLVKQRVLLNNQISLPKLKMTNFDWMKSYKTSKALKRSLVPLEGKRKRHEKPGVKLNAHIKVSNSEGTESKKGHSRAVTLSGIVIDTSSSNSIIQQGKNRFNGENMLLPERIVKRSNPSYSRRDFDSSIIPEKHAKSLTIQDLVKYIEYNMRFPPK